jgi:hypothetical protein
MEFMEIIMLGDFLVTECRFAHVHWPREVRRPYLAPFMPRLFIHVAATQNEK